MRLGRTTAIGRRTHHVFFITAKLRPPPAGTRRRGMATDSFVLLGAKK
jgi:hypothetical protein